MAGIKKDKPGGSLFSPEIVLTVRCLQIRPAHYGACLFLEDSFSFGPKSHADAESVQRITACKPPQKKSGLMQGLQGLKGPQSLKYPPALTSKSRNLGTLARNSYQPPLMKENLTIDGINIYYKGNIRQGAVVFLHGSSLNALSFQEQFRSISAFPMLAIDLPGHGRSERAEDPGAVYNIPAYARLVARIIGELELEDVVLAGHALGANIAIEAAEYLPRLRGMFLFNMSPFSIPPRLDKMCRPSPFLGYLLSGRLRPMEALRLAEEMLEGHEKLSDLLASWILDTDTAARMSFTASLGLEKFTDELAILREYIKPLAILQGRNDRLINPGYLDGLNPVSLWKNRIIELDSGHIPHMEVPQSFNALMEEFYRDVQKGSAGGKEDREPDTIQLTKKHDL